MTNVPVQQILANRLIQARPVNLTLVNLLITISTLKTGVTFTSEIIDSLNTFSELTWLTETLVYIGFAVDPGEPVRADAVVESWR